MPEGPPEQSQINSALIARKYPGSINPIPSGVQQSVDLEFETGLSSVLQLNYFPSVDGQIPATVNVVSVAANSTIGWLLSGGAGTVVNYSIYVVPATGAPYTNNYAVALNSSPQSVPALSLPNSTQTLTILSGSGYTSDSNNNFSTVVVPAVIPVNVAANGNLGWQISGLIGTNVNYYVTLSSPSPGNPTIVSSSVLLNANPTLVPRIAAGDGTQTITLTTGTYTLGANTTATITITTPTTVSVAANGMTGWNVSGAVGTVVNYSILSTPTTGSPSTSNVSVTLASNPQAVPRLAMTSGTQLLTVLAGNNYTIGGNSSATITVTSTPQNNSDPIRDINPMQSAYTSTPTFQNLPNIIATKIINAPLTISPDTTGAIAGATVIMRFVADGVNANAPVFNNFKASTGTSGWDNRAGILNFVQMVYDGTDYWYSISQAIGSSPTDTTAPTIVSRTFNNAGNTLTLLYNEPLLTSSVPPTSAFTGVNVSGVSVSGGSVILTISPALSANTSVTVGYSGTTIKDLSGNAAAASSGSATVPAGADTVPPTVVSSSVNGAGNTATITFSEALGATLPTGANFTGATVTAASIAGSVLTLTLSPAITGAVSLVYSGTAIKDVAGNNAAGFTAAISTGDITPPTVVDTAVNIAGTSATITFSEPLGATLPTGANFTGATVTAASISGAVLTLTLNPAITGSVNLVYSGTTIKDVAGNNAAGFTAALTVRTLLSMPNLPAGMTEVSVGTYRQGTTTQWVSARSTLVFTGDKTIEATFNPSQPTGNGVGLTFGTSGVSAGGSPTGGQLPAFYVANGSYNTIELGQSPTGTGQVAQLGDTIRIQRVAGVFKAQLKRANTTTWIDSKTFTGTNTTSLAAGMLLLDANQEGTIYIY